MSISGRMLARSKQNVNMAKRMGYQEIESATHIATFEAEEGIVLEAISTESSLAKIAESNWSGHLLMLVKLSNNNKDAKMRNKGSKSSPQVNNKMRIVRVWLLFGPAGPRIPFPAGKCVAHTSIHLTQCLKAADRDSFLCCENEARTLFRSLHRHFMSEQK